MFAKRRADVLNLGFRTFFKLCAWGKVSAINPYLLKHFSAAAKNIGTLTLFPGHKCSTTTNPKRNAARERLQRDTNRIGCLPPAK